VEGVGDHGCEYMTGGTVVVLGPTGRNFAAGMSGGVGYVYRLDRGRINRELVDVEPLSGADRATLRELVELHRAETGSVVATALLSDWTREIEQFSKVMPRDYRRALEAIEAAEAEGGDIDSAVMEAANA
jgi:glutamate synthase (NADPH/NADH) large chain